MTDKEKAIVMAYTGVCMLSGDKLKIFYEYVENIMGRPVYTHEMAIEAVVDEIKEKAKTDFIALCAEKEPKTGHWERISRDYVPNATAYYRCSECNEDIIGEHNYCPNCGVRMFESHESETWNGIHAQITAPKGTFERIFNEADDDYDI